MWFITVIAILKLPSLMQGCFNSKVLQSKDLGESSWVARDDPDSQCSEDWGYVVICDMWRYVICGVKTVLGCQIHPWGWSTYFPQLQLAAADSLGIASPKNPFSRLVNERMYMSHAHLPTPIKSEWWPSFRAAFGVTDAFAVIASHSKTPTA